MTPDSELLRRFAKTNSEDAFAELVKRHVNLVYSAALRQVNSDAHLAKDVAQTVFTDLARKAGSLSRRETLTGWLYTSAHFAAAKIVRTENRRRDREEKFMREPINESRTGFQPVSSAPETDRNMIRPALDDAMHELKETDREAVLLRYFENRQFAEVGAKLGLNENAARMRVERALEKLRTIFAKRGITTATAFASVISANAIQIAPANLAATLTTASIATVGTGTFTFLKIMTATKLKLAFSALVVAGATTAFVIQHQAQEKLRAENESLHQQIAQLQTDNENFSNRLAEIGDAKKLSDDQFNELLKLRGEVTQLRGDASLANDPFVQKTLALKAKVEKLKELFEERPDQRIPEIQFLTDWQWLNIARDADLDSEKGIAGALGEVRSEATQTFATMMQQALLKYMAVNNGNLPSDTLQLKSFFDTPVDDSILQRYEVLSNEQQSVSWLQDAVIAEKPSAVVISSNFMDRPVAIGPKYIGDGPVPESKNLTFPKVLVSVMQAYQSENSGQTPSDLSKLEPYITTSEQEAALQKLLNELNTKPTYKY
jgi:RNA polymerase sigma factor (sigma-70 family)